MKKENLGKELLANLKLYSDYYKWDDSKGRYETWEEAQDDILMGHRIKYFRQKDALEPYFEKAAVQMKAMNALASQRNLQFRIDQVLKHNARMYNCTSMYVARNECFQESLYLGLCGCGVGWGLLKPQVACLSNIRKRQLGTKTYVVPDSIEGWSDALGVLMSSYFVDDQPFPEFAGYEVRFDYSRIREKGAFITGGFKAPGPKGLKNALEKIEKLIESWLVNEGQVIRPILAYDILCHAADAVLSGGVRRSAANAIVDSTDEEMILAKSGNWFSENPQRGRSNNSVLLLREEADEATFRRIVALNNGMTDIGFVFANHLLEMFNPCYEILKIPMLTTEDLTTITYENLETFLRENRENLGVAFCNLNEINGETITSEQDLFDRVETAAFLGTLQAGYTNFPYLGKVTEEIAKREALLGVSIAGWCNNALLRNNGPMLQEAAARVKAVNATVSALIGTRPAARLTTVKPGGNSGVTCRITATGANPSHSRWYLRFMQINKELTAAKWLAENYPCVLEESHYSEGGTDYVISVPITCPEDGVFKDTMKDLEHVKLVEYIQENWVLPGNSPEHSVSPVSSHNTSCTIVLSDEGREETMDYIWANRHKFTAMSFVSESIDKDYAQAPFTSVLSPAEILETYGDGSMFVSGLIVDALHYFDNNIWLACDHLQNKELKLTGRREDILLKKDWLRRARKFSRNYFSGNLQRAIYCLKDVHLAHKWNVINRTLRPIDLGEVLGKPEFRDVSDYAASACSGGSCDTTRI